MSLENNQVPNRFNLIINTTVVSSGPSLIDMLNERSHPRASEDDTKLAGSSSSKTKPSTHNTGLNKSEKLSTLFNTTGRERNPTGPLKQWLYEHQDCPYPQEQDKQDLMEKTKMSASQITTWFTNARAKMRKEKKLKSNNSEKKNVGQEQNYHQEQQKQHEQQQQGDSRQFDEILDLLMSFDDARFETGVDVSSSINDTRIVMAHSCLNVHQINELHQLVSMYPNELSISDCVDDRTTHLIIGQEERPLLCPLTMKLFQATARHLYIMTPRWVSECLKKTEIIDESDYEMRGDIPFGGYHDGMRNSRLSKQSKLFRSYQFFLMCNGCQDKMSRDELASLILLCHGSLLQNFPLTVTSDSSLSTIVVCDADVPSHSSSQRQLFELSRSNGVHFLTPEWITESIVQFATQPFEDYQSEF